MDVHATLDIRYPATREGELLRRMREAAIDPWTVQEHDPFMRPAESGRVYFHRGEVGSDAPCTLCIMRRELGHLEVHAIVPDANTVREIEPQRYAAILDEFDIRIASPAAEAVEGITQRGTSMHTLADYFSENAVRLLETFCKTANHGDSGTHPSDQDKWMDFLIQVHHDRVHQEAMPVHCDTFGKCLASTGWWPKDRIAKLEEQYDFAQSLLHRAGV